MASYFTNLLGHLGVDEKILYFNFEFNNHDRNYEQNPMFCQKLSSYPKNDYLTKNNQLFNKVRYFSEVEAIL